MKKFTKKEIEQFQRKIFEWYEKNQRDLPWRKTRDPYKILVSEIMSQQTQISRVIPKYETWMKTFPTVESLAKSSTAKVLQYWSGLGYNRRALYLQKCAQALHELQVKNYQLRKNKNDNNYWPKTIEELKKLPGIGEYTAAAISCFAFDQQVAVIDTNIRKIVILLLSDGVETFLKNHESRVKNQEKIQENTLNSYFMTHNSLQQKLDMTVHDVKEIAQQLLPIGRAYAWNQALMDYAAIMLKKEKIPIPKQSHFKTSDRYFRGQIVKQLIKKQRLSLNEIEEFFKHQGTPLDDPRLQKILSGLIKDMLLTEVHGVFMLASS